VLRDERLSADACDESDRDFEAGVVGGPTTVVIAGLLLIGLVALFAAMSPAYRRTR
jgi:hypothetical protein